jgi:putative phosphoesterase
MRIGLISDTHIPEACEHLPERVFEVFAGIDLVMHAGDVYVNRVLDELSAIAPVIAALGNGDEGLDGHRYRLEPDERVREAHLVEIAGVRIGLVHAIPTPDETSDEVFARAMRTQFGWSSIRAAPRCRAIWSECRARSRYSKSETAAKSPPR